MVVMGDRELEKKGKRRKERKAKRYICTTFISGGRTYGDFS